MEKSKKNFKIEQFKPVDKSKEIDKVLFVNLQAPTELRRRMLETSKSIVFILKNYHKISLMREEKQKLLSMLKIQIGEITLLCNKLSNYIPEYSFALEKSKMPKTKKSKQPTRIQKGKPVANISEIDQLQSQLNKIEDQLKNLK